MHLSRRCPKAIEPLAELAAQYRNTDFSDQQVGKIGHVPITVEMLAIVYELYFRMPLNAWPDLDSAVLTDEFGNDWLPAELAPGQREH
jgi:hypothetical protein